VLDSTEINRDWFLAGPDFRLLRYLAREAGLRPRVPAAVVAETVANHARKYEAARTDFLKAGLAMRRVAGNAVRLADVPERLDYAEVLEQRLENLWVEVMDPPPTPHMEIVARASARRRPFDKTGSGYRDALTWMTCLELAREGGRVFLVSQDLDFAGEDRELAPDLTDEVAALPGSVTLVRELRRWLLPLSPWKEVTNAQEAAARALDEEVEALFTPWDMFEDMRFTAPDLGLPPGATIHQVEYYESGGLDRVRHEKNDDGAEMVLYKFAIEFEVELSLRSDEAIEAGLLSEDGGPVHHLHHITTTVPMTGFLTVIHDEGDPDFPLYFDAVEFEAGRIFLGRAREDDPEQLRLPFDED